MQTLVTISGQTTHHRNLKVVSKNSPYLNLLAVQISLKLSKGFKSWNSPQTTQVSHQNSQIQPDPPTVNINLTICLSYYFNT